MKKFSITYEGNWWLLYIDGFGWCTVKRGLSDDTDDVMFDTFEELITRFPQVLCDIKFMERLILKGVI